MFNLFLTGLDHFLRDEASRLGAGKKLDYLF